MASKEIVWSVKILGIVGAILSGISLIIPWAGYDIDGSGLSIYTWGTSTYTSKLSLWDYFNIELFTASPITTEAILFGIFMIITLVFTLIAFIIGLTGFRHIGVRSSNSFLTAGIMGVIAMIMFVIGLSRLTSVSSGTSPIGYGIGFILIIISFILYFIGYGIQKALIPVPKTVPYQQPIYQQPPYQQQGYQQPTYQQPPPPQHPQQQQQQEPKAQFCPECGTKKLPGAKFCSKCGKTF